MARKRDALYYRYAQFATAFSFARAMHAAGVDTETLADVNWLANTEWTAFMRKYEEDIQDVPDNTHDQMSSLLFQDLMDQFDAFAQSIVKDEDA